MDDFWAKRWHRIRVEIWRFALKVGLGLLVLSLFLVLWPDAVHQPLQSSDLLDLRDNSGSIMVPLVLHNAGWLPLELFRVDLTGIGDWQDVEVQGWLKEVQPQLGPEERIEYDGLADITQTLQPGQTGQLLVTLFPRVGSGKQQLELHYRNFIGIPYKLIVPLQDDGVFIASDHG